MTQPRTPLPTPHPGHTLPTTAAGLEAPGGLRGLRTVGIVLQSALGALALPVLLFVAAFIDDPNADVGLILAILAGLALWCVAGPFLYAGATRRRSSSARVVLPFFLFGAGSLIAVGLVLQVVITIGRALGAG